MMSRNWKRHTESVYIFKTRTEALDWLQRRGKTYCVFSSAQGEKQQERGGSGKLMLHNSTRR